MFDVGRRQHDARTVNVRVRFDKTAFVRVNNLKPIQRFAIAAGQSVADVIEVHAQLAIFNVQRLEDRPGELQFVVAISLGQRQQREPMADVLFVLGMNVIEIADIVDHRHAGVGNGLSGGLLRLPEFSLRFRISADNCRAQSERNKTGNPLRAIARASR